MIEVDTIQLFEVRISISSTIKNTGGRFVVNNHVLYISDGLLDYWTIGLLDYWTNGLCPIQFQILLDYWTYT